MPPESTPIEIDRVQLHRLVWAAPIAKTAERMTVTPTTLRRMVEILDVSLPGRGNWMNGHKPCAKPLPPREDGGPETLRLVRGRKHMVLEHDPQAARHGKAPASLPTGLHPIVHRAARHYARPLVGADGTMKPRTSAAPSLRVSVEQRERALAFADLLVRRLEKEGCAVSWNGPIGVETPDGKAALWLREETEAVERPPSPAEAEKDRGRLFRYGPRRYYVERPTGRLLLAVRDPLFGVKETHAWRDEGRRTLEGSVKQIVRELLAYQRARLDAKVKEQAIQDARAREHARRMLDKRAREHEEERRKRLCEEIAAWKRAATIRKYADALEAAQCERVDRDPMAVLEWLAWMRSHADEVDPTVLSAPTSVIGESPPAG